MIESRYSPLAWAFFKIGMVGFGGGYAMLPMISHQVVDVAGWISHGEFADLVAISQMTPGPIAINSATYVGFLVGGVLGSAVATLSVCFPVLVITLIACRYFQRLKGNPRLEGAMLLLRPAVVGLVAAAALSLANGENFIDFLSGALFLVTLGLTLWGKANPIAIFIGAGLVGWLAYG